MTACRPRLHARSRSYGRRNLPITSTIFVARFLGSTGAGLAGFAKVPFLAACFGFTHTDDLRHFFQAFRFIPTFTLNPPTTTYTVKTESVVPLLLYSTKDADLEPESPPAALQAPIVIRDDKRIANGFILLLKSCKGAHLSLHHCSTSSSFSSTKSRQPRCPELQARSIISNSRVSLRDRIQAINIRRKEEAAKHHHDTRSAR